MHDNIFFLLWIWKMIVWFFRTRHLFIYSFLFFFLCKIYVIVSQTEVLKRFVYWHQFKLNLIAISRIAKPKNCHRNIHHHHDHHHTMYKHLSSFFFRRRPLLLLILSKYHLYEYYLFIFRFSLAWPRRSNKRTNEHTVNKCWYQTNWSGWTQHDHILYIFIL